MAALTQIRALRSHLFRRPAPVLLRAPQRTPKTPLLFREIPHDLRKSSGVFVSSAQVRKFRSGMRSPMQADASKHDLLAPLRATRCPFSAISGAPERFLVLLSYILPPTGQKDALAQNNSANAARPKPSIRVGTAPHSPRKPQKARRCGSVDGLFRRVGQRLPTFFISGCVPRNRKCA